MHVVPRLQLAVQLLLVELDHAKGRCVTARALLAELVILYERLDALHSACQVLGETVDAVRVVHLD